MRIGAFRRIDNLGRVVIPKSIRKDMNLNPGDHLQIIEDEGEIKIKKYSELGKIESLLKIIYKIIKEKFKTEIYITDKEKILLPNIIDNKLSEIIIKEINSRKTKSIDNITITNKIKGNITIKPIIANGDLYGSLIIESKNNKEEIIEIMTNIITKSLEE